MTYIVPAFKFLLKKQSYIKKFVICQVVAHNHNPEMLCAVVALERSVILKKKYIYAKNTINSHNKQYDRKKYFKFVTSISLLYSLF